jgi:hypothetical protein
MDFDLICKEFKEKMLVVFPKVFDDIQISSYLKLVSCEAIS